MAKCAQRTSYKPQVPSITCLYSFLYHCTEFVKYVTNDSNREGCSTLIRVVIYIIIQYVYMVLKAAVVLELYIKTVKSSLICHEAEHSFLAL